MRFWSWVLVIGTCLLVAAVLGFYKYSAIQGAIARGNAFPEPMEAVVAVTTTGIERQSGLTVSGVVVATQSAELRNELAGRIATVGFAAGSQVTQGQLLVALDTAQERAQWAEAQASLEIARLALARAERLVKSGAGSVEARDQANAQFEEASARARALAATIDKKTLRAPFAGIASLHQLEVGQYLPAGSMVATLIGRDRNLWIDFSVPQSQADLQPETVVQIRADDLELGVLAATVIARDPSVQASSRNLRFRAELTAPPAALLPGMLVKVHVPIGDVRQLVTVPSQAIRHDSLGTSVYLLKETTESGQTRLRAERRTVVVSAVGLPDASDQLVIEEGLVAGQRIAASGAFKLRDGSLVQVVERDPAAVDRLVGH